MKQSANGLVGAVFGRLTVLSVEKIDGRDWLHCRCACGAQKRFYGSNVRLGKTTSCGCVQKERASRANSTHHGAGAPEYNIWQKIKGRCLSPDDPAFGDYGGRGITICPEWRDDFAAFYAHVGSRPSKRHSIDRRDNSKGYEPGNVRWATKVEQARNTRGNRVVTYEGREMTVAEAMERSGTKTPWPTIYHRLHRGWPIERALT